MSEVKKADNQDHDLKWQKQDESENIQKSANPDTEYMRDHNLCTKCHGNRRVCGEASCPQKAG